MTFEVVVYNIESALKAQEAGADRIEVCSNPGEGGTTPSYGLIEAIRQNVSLDVYVMIRPRGGDFHYSNYEFHAMKRDISQCQKLSVDGIVLGILNPDGTIDKKRCKELIEKARPLKVTCHRAFDMTRDPLESLEDCIEVGFDRILTSGGESKAIDGVNVISSLVAAARGRIAIMPGSGINDRNVETIVSTTKVKEIHFSAVSYRESEMKFTNTSLQSMGTTGDEYKLRTVDMDLIRRMRKMISS